MLSVFIYVYCCTSLCMSLVEQELTTFPKHLSSTQFLWNSCSLIINFSCSVLQFIVLLSVFFWSLHCCLSFDLSLRNTCVPIDIFKLLLCKCYRLSVVNIEEFINLRIDHGEYNVLDLSILILTSSRINVYFTGKSPQSWVFYYRLKVCRDFTTNIKSHDIKILQKCFLM